jgi:hypothetical protein
MTPAEFTLLPRALSVIVPQCTGEETVNVAHKGDPGTA